MILGSDPDSAARRWFGARPSPPNRAQTPLSRHSTNSFKVESYQRFTHKGWRPICCISCRLHGDGFEAMHDGPQNWGQSPIRGDAADPNRQLFAELGSDPKFATDCGCGCGCGCARVTNATVICGRIRFQICLRLRLRLRQSHQCSGDLRANRISDLPPTAIAAESPAQ